MYKGSYYGNQKFKQNAKKTAEILTNPNGVMIQNKDGSFFNTKDSGRWGQQFSCLEAASAFMYSLMNSGTSDRPELSVSNPKPKQFDPRYLVPRDAFLWDEGKQLMDAAKRNLDDFHERLKSIIAKGVSTINFVGDLNKQGTTRVTGMFLFLENMTNFPKMDDIYDFVCMGRVLGANVASKNVTLAADFEAKVLKWQDENTADWVYKKLDS